MRAAGENVFAERYMPLDISLGHRALGSLAGRLPETTAIPLLPVDSYGSQEWLSARRTMIGASELAAVLGCSPHASPFSLWWAKHEGWEVEQTQQMRIGHLLEPVIAQLFAESRPDLLIYSSSASLWRHPIVEWMACTPDYLAVVGVGSDCHVEPVECKSDEGGAGWGEPGSSDVPAHHRIQVLQQCEVFDAPVGHLVRMAGKRFSAYVIAYDDDAKTDMTGWMTTGASFMESLAQGVPPPLDGHEATGRVLEQLYPSEDPTPDVFVDDALVTSYQNSWLAMGAAKREFKAAQNRIRAALGDAPYGRVASTGRRFVNRRIYLRAGYTVEAHVVDGLYPIRGKK